MTNRTDLRTRIRYELNDALIGNYLYPDSLLNFYIEEALRDWSFRCPPVRNATITPVNGQRIYPLNFDLQRIIRVEQPQGTRLPNGNIALEPQQNFKPYVQAWQFTKARELTLRYNSVSGDANLILTYYGYYLIPADDTTVLDVEEPDENALVWLVCSRAIQWLDTQRGQRGDATRNTRTKIYTERYREAFRAALRRKGIATFRLQHEV
jgi:hypothetical protein